GGERLVGVGRLLDEGDLRGDLDRLLDAEVDDHGRDGGRAGERLVARRAALAAGEQVLEQIVRRTVGDYRGALDPRPIFEFDAGRAAALAQDAPDARKGSDGSAALGDQV